MDYSWLLSNSGFNVYATELEPNSLFSGLIYEHPNLGIGHRIVCDSRISPFENKSIDVVFCKEIVHHIPDKKDFFLNVNKILKKDGYFLMIEPLYSLQSYFYYRKYPDPIPDHFYVSLYHYFRALKSSGFNITKFGLFFYKEAGRNILTNWIKKKFNAEIIKGISNKFNFIKFLYGHLLGGSVIILAKKKIDTNYVSSTKANREIKLIPPSFVTLNEEDLSKLNKFFELLKETDKKYSTGK